MDKLDVKAVSMEIDKLALEPDELLLIRPKEHLNRAQAEHWTAVFRRYLDEAGIKNKIMMVPPGTEFGKIKAGKCGVPK
jgi:hypothetical protein